MADSKGFIVFGHNQTTGDNVVATAYRWDSDNGVGAPYDHIGMLKGNGYYGATISPGGRSVVTSASGAPDSINTYAFSEEEGWGDRIPTPDLEYPLGLYSPTGRPVFSPGGNLVVAQSATPPKAFRYDNGVEGGEFSVSTALPSGNSTLYTFSPGGQWLVGGNGLAERWSEEDGFLGITSTLSPGPGAGYSDAPPVFHGSGNYVCTRRGIYRWDEDTGFGEHIQATSWAYYSFDVNTSGTILVSIDYSYNADVNRTWYLRAYRWNEDGTLSDLHPPPVPAPGDAGWPLTQSMTAGKLGPQDSTILVGLSGGAQTPIVVLGWDNDTGFGGMIPITPPTHSIGSIYTISYYAEPTPPPPPTEHGVLVRGKWQWTSSGGASKWTRPQQGIRLPRLSEERQDAYDVYRSRLKIRGRGESVAINFTSEPGKDFVLLGWVVHYKGETDD